MKKYLAMVIVCLLSLFLLSGCGIGDKISALREDFRQDDDSISDVNVDVPEVIIMPDGTATMDPNDSTEALNPAIETKTVLLYFTDQLGEELVAEEREIAKVEGIARASIEALLAGPENTDLQSALPQGTRLMDINIKEDGLAIVDFSSELADNLESSSKKEKMAVYSIVNTLTQFPTVERVEIRVNGKTVNTLKGKIKLNQDLFRDETIIKSS